MKAIALFLILFSVLSCSSSSGENRDNLALYREPALRYLVKERLKKEIASDPRFQTLSIWNLPGSFMMLGQKDNVDRSEAVFTLQGEKEAEEITCGLYIREAHSTQLKVNLIGCQGLHWQALSGGKEYGLPLLTVNKAGLGAAK